MMRSSKPSHLEEEQKGSRSVGQGMLNWSEAKWLTVLWNDESNFSWLVFFSAANVFLPQKSSIKFFVQIKSKVIQRRLCKRKWGAIKLPKSTEMITYTKLGTV